MNKIQKIQKTIIVCLTVVLVDGAYAHESDREIKLQIANDELALRLADVLSENKRLEKFVDNALSAKASGQKVVLGCDPDKLESHIVLDLSSDNETSKKRKAEMWIKENGPECTVGQLQHIYDTIENYLMYYPDPQKILSYMIRTRT